MYSKTLRKIQIRTNFTYFQRLQQNLRQHCLDDLITDFQLISIYKFNYSQIFQKVYIKTHEIGIIILADAMFGPTEIS